MKETEGTSSGPELMEPSSPEALLPGIGLWPWWLAAGILLLSLLALAWFLHRRSRQKPDPSTQRNTAYSEAMASFENITGADPRNAAIQSSLILRRYLSIAAGDPALFETHEEYLSRHDALQALAPEVRETAAAGFSRLAALKYSPELPEADPQEIVSGSKDLLQSLHQGFIA